MSDVIAVQAVLTSSLPTLTIDGTNAEAYELHPDTKAEQAVSWRKQEASGPWVEGTFVTSAVRESIIETLAVWVNGPTSDLVEQRVYELTRRLSLLSYSIDLTLDGVTHAWTCVSPADFTVARRHEYLHQPLALVTARVPRLPRAVVSGEFGSVTT